MLRRYETLVLAVPEITKDEASAVEAQLEQTVRKAQGTIISFERWGKYRLAYPVRDNDYGVYYLVRFEVEGEQGGELAKDIRALLAFKYNDIVMRNMTTHLPLNKSLAYQRPESLDEVATQDVDTFIKENKMEGLLSSVPSDSKKTAKVEVEEVVVESETEQKG